MVGIEVIINQKTLLKVPNSGRFILNTKERSVEVEAIKKCLFENSGNFCSYDFGKVKNMKKDFKLMFKVLIDYRIPKEDNTD